MGERKPPKKPVPYSRYNWPTREAYDQAVRIWEIAMGVYLATQNNKDN